MHLAPTIAGLIEVEAWGRSDLHSPNDAWTSQPHDGLGIRQDRRGMNAASSPLCQNGDSRLAATGRSGFGEQIDTMLRHSDSAGLLETHATTRVFGGPAGR